MLSWVNEVGGGEGEVRRFRCGGGGGVDGWRWRVSDGKSLWRWGVWCGYFPRLVLEIGE